MSMRWANLAAVCIAPPSRSPPPDAIAVAVGIAVVIGRTSTVQDSFNSDSRWKNQSERRSEFFLSSWYITVLTRHFDRTSRLVDWSTGPPVYWSTGRLEQQFVVHFIDAYSRWFYCRGAVRPLYVPAAFVCLSALMWLLTSGASRSQPPPAIPIGWFVLSATGSRPSGAIETARL